mmetsp:Transcript_63757/g.150893  ORF Transcript_63757/g.150893 Transcript_63757/m.150893 type:complete len:262 (-) Transcript_63757:94-879(-)
MEQQQTQPHYPGLDSFAGLQATSSAAADHTAAQNQQYMMQEMAPDPNFLNMRPQQPAAPQPGVPPAPQQLPPGHDQLAYQQMGGDKNLQLGIGGAPPVPTDPNAVQATYKVSCPLCGTLLQVVLPPGVTSFQCAQCNAVFMVQQTAPVEPSTIGKTRRKKKEKKERPPRQPTPYNLFIKSELAKVKSEQPHLSHREAFRLASKRWASSSENPKCGEHAAAPAITSGAAPTAQPPPAVSAEKEGEEGFAVLNPEPAAEQTSA